MLVAAARAPGAESAVAELSIETPRAFGYVIGDVIVHEVALELRALYELDRESLPETGRINRWLELRDVVLGSRGRRHAIVLSYQVVNATENVIGVGTPAHMLSVIGPEGELGVVVPAWGFTIAPLVRDDERPPGTQPELQPAEPPPPIPTEASRATVVALGLALAALVVGLAGRAFGDVLAVRTARPFARACRRLGRGAPSAAPAAYRDALAEIHQAINATAGRAVFAHNLARFLEDHPRYEPLRASFESLFAETHRAFYAGGAQPHVSADAFEALRELCRACRELERRT